MKKRNKLTDRIFGFFLSFKLSEMMLENNTVDRRESLKVEEEKK